MNLITTRNEHKTGKKSSVSGNGQGLADNIDWECVEILDIARSERLLF